VSRHLDTCHDCAARIAQWSRVDELLGLEIPEPNLAGNVLEAIRQERSQVVPWWMRVASAAVVSLALGSLAGFYTTNAAERTTAPSSEVLTFDALDASFGPEAMAGIDQIAVLLSQEAER
jgi:anti-sigma factor RsiW